MNLFTAVAYSPDGKLLAAGEFDSPLLIIDAATGTILHKSTGHSAAILDVRFTTDSRYIATASFDKLAKLWDAASGQELASFYGNAKNAWSASFTPDGQRLAVGGWDGTARIFVVPLDELVALAESRLTRALTTEECQKYLHTEQCPAD
jgi:WD40 repeat protein